MSKILKLENYRIRLMEAAEIEQALGELAQRFMPSRIFVLVDENTYGDCWPLISQMAAVASAIPLKVKSGELNKNLSTCEQLWTALMEAGADRHSLLLNLGGGVIGDMGGFVASTYMRGLPFVQIPTTLLSMVDASVGGKLGVDFQGLKNMIGLFADPAEVIVCPAFLKTLPERELKSGMAEIYKHALVADADHWTNLKKFDYLNASGESWMEMIAHSVNIKRQIVEQDQREAGLRKVLNFGHSIGHAIESWSLENSSQSMLHGEAIAIGMICEGWISRKKLGFADDAHQEMMAFFQKTFPRRDINALTERIFFDLLQHDKKNRSGNLQFSLIRKLGDCAFDIEVQPALAWSAVEFYKNNYAV